MSRKFLTEHPLSDCDFRQGLTMSLQLGLAYTSTELRDRQQQLKVSQRNSVQHKSQIKPKSESQHIAQTLASQALKNPSAATPIGQSVRFLKSKRRRMTSGNRLKSTSTTRTDPALPSHGDAGPRASISFLFSFYFSFF